MTVSTRFLERLTPAGYTGSEASVLRLAFVSDAAFKSGGDQRAVAIALRKVDENLVCRVAGLDEVVDLETIQTQVERLLSLDIDGGRLSLPFD